MNSGRVLDVSHLPPYEISNRSPLWLGQLLMAVIEGSLFSILLAMYVYLRLSVDVWPPPGTQLPQLTYATIGLVFLILSTAGSYIASEGAKKDSRFTMIAGMVLNLVPAIAFLGFRAAELNTVNFNWKTDVHGSIFWSIVFLHSLDAVADLVFTFVLLIILLLGKHGDRQRIAVHVDSVLWYFIVLIWLPAYALLYLGPRLPGGS